MSPTSAAILAGVAVAHMGLALYLYTEHFIPSRAEPPAPPPSFVVDLERLSPVKPPPQVHKIPQRTLPVHIEHDVALQPDQTIKVQAPTPQTPIIDTKPRVLANVEVAQPPEPPRTRHVITEPHWLSQPTADEFADAYPQRAITLGRSGAVDLACTVLVSGAVTDCSVAQETPAGWGFGAAALKLAKRFRLAPREEDGSPVGGAMVRIPIRFTLSS